VPSPAARLRAELLIPAHQPHTSAQLPKTRAHQTKTERDGLNNTHIIKEVKRLSCIFCLFLLQVCATCLTSESSSTKIANGALVSCRSDGTQAFFDNRCIPCREAGARQDRGLPGTGRQTSASAMTLYQESSRGSSVGLQSCLRPVYRNSAGTIGARLGSRRTASWNSRRAPSRSPAMSRARPRFRWISGRGSRSRASR
jgi:hypothetical protein